MSDISLRQPAHEFELESSKYFRNALSEQWPFVCFCTLYSLLAGFFLIINGYTSAFDVIFSVFRWFSLNFMIFGSAALSIYAIIFFLSYRPKSSPTMAFWRHLRKDVFSNRNLPKLIIAVTGLSFVMSTFVLFKAAIPQIHPFAYDELFAELDAWFHFGYQPWHLVQNLIPHEWMTWVIHRNYYLWFPVIFITFFWQAGSTNDPASRNQFLLAFVACWVLIGSLLALAMSSAGPIFYSRVVPDGEDVYLAAHQYLNNVHENTPLFMFQIKETLWLNYLNFGEDGFVKGISAMPSMHVSISFLLIMFGFRKGRLPAIAYTVFGILITVGSVHLLWHYAIDAYVAIVATFIIWKVCGWIVRNTSSQLLNQPIR